MTILIDLPAQLTNENIAEALPHVGQCRYAAPCIIGTMIPEDKRAEFDDLDANDVESLVAQGLIAFTNPDHVALAQELQSDFDSGVSPLFLATATAIRSQLNA